jgi:hypothetical protein
MWDRYEDDENEEEEDVCVKPGLSYDYTSILIAHVNINAGRCN